MKMSAGGNRSDSRSYWYGGREKHSTVTQIFIKVPEEELNFSEFLDVSTVAPVSTKFEITS